MSLNLNKTYKDLQVSGEKTQVDGSCKCGAIKYNVKIPIAPEGTFVATKCNCSFCGKFGITSLSPESPQDFTLIQPSNKEEIPGDYTRNPSTQHRYFCNMCGVHVFQEGEYEYEGTKHAFFSVNAATLDQPQERVDLSKVKIGYWDGLSNNWGSGMKDTPWPNGLP